MEIDELKTLIDECYGLDNLQDLVADECNEDPDFDAKVGMPYKFLEKESEYEGDDCYDETYRFQIGTKIYELKGSYSSWGDGGIDNIETFYEVVPVQKTITVYERKEA